MIRRLLLILALCLLPLTAHAAITFDAASSSEGTTSTSGTATIAADANIIIVCVANRDNGGAAVAATAVTVGGEAATKLHSKVSSNGVMQADIWYKLTPLTGSQTVAATGGASTDAMVTGWMSFKGVAQTSTFNTVDDAESAGTTNADIDGIPSAVGEMVAGCFSVRVSVANNTSPDATAPTSDERYEDLNNGTNNMKGAGYTEDGAVTSINMRVDLSESNEFAAVAASMRPSVASGIKAHHKTVLE